MSWYTNALMSFLSSRTRRRLNTTLSALKALPSWKVTPLRSLNRQAVLVMACHDSARAGTNRLSLVTSTSGSKTWRSTEVEEIE